MSDLKIYKNQETVRFSDADLNYLHECYEAMSGTDQRIPIGNFFIKVLELANQRTKPAPINVTETTEYQLLMKRVQDEKEGREVAENKVNELTGLLAERTRQLNESGIVAKDHILLDFSKNPDYKTYIEDILIIAKSKEYAPDMAVLITRIISEFQKAGYFNLTEDDKETIRKQREQWNQETK